MRNPAVNSTKPTGPGESIPSAPPAEARRLSIRAWILAGVLALILAACALYLALPAQPQRSVSAGGSESDTRVVQILRGGDLLYEIPLASVAEPRELLLEGEGGAYNRIMLSADGVSVAEASCPDQICVRTGEIRTSLLPIVCVPNGLVVRIVDVDADPDEGSLDAVTY